MNLRPFISFLLAWSLTISGFAQTNLNDWLKSSSGAASVKLTQHDYNFFNRPESHRSFTVGNPEESQEIAFQESVWQMNYQTIIPEDRKDALEVEFHFRLIKGSSPQTSISIDRKSVV